MTEQNNGAILKALLSERNSTFGIHDAAILIRLDGWPDSDPSPLQILEVLDLYSIKKDASENIVNFLRNCYHVSLEDANVDHADVVKNATWR